jgi:membrane-associated phospholipid phosphatase
MRLSHFPILLFFICLTAVPVLAQQAEPAGDSSTAVENPNSPQEFKASEIQKKENPPEPEAHGSRLQWKDIPRNVLHDEKAIFLSPFRINRENAKWWALLGGGTAAFIALDQRISNNLPQRTALTKPSKWASRLGADYFIFPAWASFYLVGKADKNPRARDTGRIGIEALIDSEIAVNILKLATQRPRPEIKGESVGFFKGGDAFPSGHSIKSWALARVVAREYPDSKIVPILAYSAASTVSIARFGGRRHSASDALAGAAMGFFIGDYVYRHHHAPSPKSAAALTWVASHVNFDFGLSGSRIPPAGFAGAPGVPGGPLQR